MTRRVGLAIAMASLLAVPPIALAQTAIPAPAKIRIDRTSLYVPVRDGTRLAVNIYRPMTADASARFPVVFAFTPYRARYVDKDGKTVELVDSPHLGLRKLAEAGYVVATADIRGKGASFGARRGFLDQTEARDGRDLVEWLAGQPWSTGKVGIIGCSYLGGTAMLVAGALPPSLRAVFAAATDLDKYSFVRNGGVTAQFNTRPDEPLEVDAASVPVDADKDGALLKAAVAQHAGNTPMAKLWEGMPYRNSISPLTGNRFWEEVGPYTHLKALRSPQLAWYFWSNWEDEPTEQMILAAANIKSKLIVGPGSHCVPPKQFDINAEQQRFFDHYLKGIANGIDREPRYAWWREAGEGTLVRSDTLPGVGIKRTPIYFATDGTTHHGLGDAPALPGSANFRVSYDVGKGEYFAFWPPVPDAWGQSYTSAPLAADAEMLGYPVAHVRMALDRNDAILFTYLEDVAPDGSVKLISFGRLAASHRKLSKPPYDRLDLPYHSGLATDIVPMLPGKLDTLSLSMVPRSWTFRAGHRLRVTIAGADPRQRNLAQIRQDPAPLFTILSGGTAGSRVDIPFTSKPAFR